MELLQLKYFQTAARTQNFSQAAEELNITQPSLSITISRLEAELKINLFDRKGRNIILNEAGAAFLQRVNTVFSELDSAKEELLYIAGLQNNHITLSTTGAQLLSVILKDYLRTHQEIVINQRCGVFQEVTRQLISGEVDFCITLPPVEGKNIECRILKVEEIVLVVPESHRFAKRSFIKLSEAADDDFITLPPNHNFREVTNALCRQAGFTPKVLFEVDDSLLEEMIELGRGITLLPLYMVERPHTQKHKLKMLRITEPDMHIRIGLSWQKNKYFSDTAKEFRNFIIQNY